MQQLGRTAIIADRRFRSLERARLSVIPTNPRWGRVMRACRRALIANQSASVSQIREWAYCGQPYQTWHCREIRRALKQIRAQYLGRSPIGMGAPGIWSIKPRN
jgi:hypothetical protein